MLGRGPDGARAVRHSVSCGGRRFCLAWGRLAMRARHRLTAPLSCMTSTASSARNQCSETCENADDCSNVSGACLRAGLCVKSCETSSDCPSGTACNEFSWCQQTEHGALCAGTPTGCETEVNCDDAAGCYSKYSRTGTPTACGELNELILCVDSGCDWDLSAHFCSGAPKPCSSGIGVRTCSAILGGYWKATCAGTPRPCESLDATRCKSTAGCVA